MNIVTYQYFYVYFRVQQGQGAEEDHRQQAARGHLFGGEVRGQQGSLGFLLPELRQVITHSPRKAIEKLVDTVKETIKDEDQSPKTKFYAIKLLHDTMKTQNKLLGNYVVKKILKRLAILAAFKKESKDESRGKSIFGKVRPDQENYAKKFHHQLLDSLREWGTSWPRGADGPHLAFKEKYEELVK